MVEPATVQTLSTSTGELVYQLASLVISAVVTIVGAYIRNWMKTSELAKKYQLDNEATERILRNAVVYAEEQGKLLAKTGIDKRHLAIKYVETVKPELIHDYGSKLEVMVDRKAAQLKILNGPETLK